jgi:predicted Zn-dependent protease
MTWRWLVGCAALLLLAACAEIAPKLTNRMTGYIKERASANAERVADNTVDAVAAGKLTRSSTFSMEQEFYLGKTIAANVVVRMGARALAPDSAPARYVRDIGTVVALAAADARSEEDRPYPMKGYRFIVVEAPQVNAVGMPGGFVVVTTGALAAARSEDEVAAMLAHEVAHVQRGHVMAPVEAARQQEHITSTMLAGTDQLVHAFFGKVVRAGTDFVLDKSYGKQNELEADALAQETLTAAGYDPQALPRLLSRLRGKAAEGGFLQRHPSSADRVQALGAAPLQPIVASAGPRTARFQERLRTIR